MVIVAGAGQSIDAGNDTDLALAIEKSLENGGIKKENGTSQNREIVPIPEERQNQTNHQL